MSSPIPAAPAPPPSPEYRRVVLGVAFAAVGFAAVWQGFGLAGYGTDWHLNRALFAFLALLSVAVFVVGRRMWRVVRLAAALVGLFGAAHAWWEIRSSGTKSAMSLREAVQTRDWYRGRLAVATAEEAEKSDGQRGLRLLLDQFPSLCAGLEAEHNRWADAVTADIEARYAKLPPEDSAAAEALITPAKALAAGHPASADRLEAARRGWVARAVAARTDELRAVPPGEWDGFSRTAFGRRGLAEAVPAARDALLAAESEWVEATVSRLIANPGGPSPRAAWKQAHWDVLALKSLDTADARFAAARGRLFVAALDSARADAFGHFEAGRHDRAFGVARAHPVDWDSVAAALGERERQALAEFRDAHAFFAALAERAAAGPEVAPAPRTKP